MREGGPPELQHLWKDRGWAQQCCGGGAAGIESCSQGVDWGVPAVKGGVRRLGCLTQPAWKAWLGALGVPAHEHISCHAGCSLGPDCCDASCGMVASLRSGAGALLWVGNAAPCGEWFEGRELLLHPCRDVQRSPGLAA